MPLPLMTYEFLCNLYGEAFVRKFYVPFTMVSFDPRGA